jgi:hypothetical protein
VENLKSIIWPTYETRKKKRKLSSMQVEGRKYQK